MSLTADRALVATSDSNPTNSASKDLNKGKAVGKAKAAVKPIAKAKSKSQTKSVVGSKSKIKSARKGTDAQSVSLDAAADQLLVAAGSQAKAEKKRSQGIESC